MYLSDLRAGAAPQYGFVRYGLYISFFPQILSGPLVRWREIMHQFDASPLGPTTIERCARGMVLLVLGLCEKTLLGDSLAQIANPIFTASQTTSLSASDAWLGTLAFSFQIYFDFAFVHQIAVVTFTSQKNLPLKLLILIPLLYIMVAWNSGYIVGQTFVKHLSYTRHTLAKYLLNT